MKLLFRALSLAGLAMAVPGDARSEPLVFPLDEVLALAQWAHSGPEGFTDQLQSVLRQIHIEETAGHDDADDPFRWAIGGSFGGPGAVPRPGAIFGCARYGLATRDLFAEFGFARPETFGLMGEVLPLSDDAEVWPENAVARLHCSFIWDDTETVSIIPERTAHAALSEVFETIHANQGGAVFAPLLGDGGFRLSGENGQGDSVVWVESGEVILTNGHQQVSFRAFLMGGAV